MRCEVSGDRWLGGADRWIRSLLLSPFVRPKTVAALIEARQEDLHFLKELIEAGEVTPVIDRTYSLSEIADAFRYLEQDRARETM